MKKTKATVADIAKEAGVSPATVSRALNHRSLVKSQTINKIEKAMAALGCPMQPKPFDADARQPLIVVNLPGIDNVFYQDVVKGIRASAKMHGCHLLIHESPLTRGSVPEFCHLLTRVEAAGTIILSQAGKDSLEQIHAITPLVQCCEYNDETDYPYVSIDDFHAAETATEYLISCGCRKISLINGPLSFKYARLRQEGFLNALKNADIFVPQNWMLQLPEVNFETAYASICRVLNLETVPNAFFAISDIFAAAAIRAAARYHLKVPDDIMVIGFDNIDISMMTCPSITTIKQPSFQQGYFACEILNEIIENPAAMPKSLLLDTELIIRESTLKF